MSFYWKKQLLFRIKALQKDAISGIMFKVDCQIINVLDDAAHVLRASDRSQEPQSI